MSHVDERVPLIMICCIRAEPGSYLLTGCIQQCLVRQVIYPSTGHTNYGCPCQFHIICPVVFSIDIWRSDRCSLSYSHFFFAVLICRLSLLKKELGIITIGSEKNLIA